MNKDNQDIDRGKKSVSESSDDLGGQHDMTVSYRKFRTDTPFAVIILCCLLVLAVAVVFGRTVGYEFVNFDDDEYVYENPQVAGGMTLQGIEWAFTAGHANNWHPLTWLTHMMDVHLYGLLPGGHHLTNILLHAATANLLFLLLWRMTGFLWRSFFVAAVFAVHPLRVESVLWISERKDLLSGLFFMLTLWAYVRYARRAFSLGRYLAVTALFVLGLMSKPMLVTLPFVLLLLDYWPLGRMDMATNGGTSPFPRRLILEKIPLLALAAASSIVTLLVQNRLIVSVGDFPRAGLGKLDRCISGKAAL